MEKLDNITYTEILDIADNELQKIVGKSMDLVTISQPKDMEMAIQLTKVVSKLSPLLGNLIEFSTIDILNTYCWEDIGKWKRQDPGFPDTTFESMKVVPNPGIEIKTWFPLSTEITARFKDSVKYFADNQIQIALLAWLPEFVFWGKPKIIDVCIVNANSVAKARDLHYHNPPRYLVLEPEDTSSRTANLQQTNTNGYVIQNENQISEATEIMKKYGDNWNKYSENSEYQQFLKKIFGQYSYRLDTNYAKIDRIRHTEIEKFKAKVLNTKFQDKTIQEWATLSAGKDSEQFKKSLEELLKLQ